MTEVYSTRDPLDPLRDLIRETEKIQAARDNRQAIANAVDRGLDATRKAFEVTAADAIRKLNGTMESRPAVSEHKFVAVPSTPEPDGLASCTEVAKKIPGLTVKHFEQPGGGRMTHKTHYEYMPKAMQIVKELALVNPGVVWDPEALLTKKRVDIVANHLSLAVAHKPKHFTVHTKCLENGTFEARIETIEKWCAAVVTAKTMVEVVEQAQKIGVVL